MNVLVVGAGAIGGYFGGRLLEKNIDVTFLVRERRRKQLVEHGLIIESVNGNASFMPKTIVTGENADHFDVIILSTKAYHLDGAIQDIQPYVTEGTVIMPLLNGISHIQKLSDVFGEENVIGGLCSIESTLDKEGKILQTSPLNNLVFGELSGERSKRILKMEEMFSGTKVNYKLSENVNQDLWHKYLFITTMSGITTLMRSPIGPIRDEESGRETLKWLLKEIISVMNLVHAPIAENIEDIQLKQIEGLGYTMKTSMQRDMEKLMPVEADHLQGYLLGIARKEGLSVPILQAVYANLKIYEEQLSK
ncbi:ketopantoate reductase family protein [Neobacillus sp. PS3-40]|uniref:ketopantoate reductase family protein n=1 Tax=Neobacillus sp. PS3-40 TaxID=3070679 RepID=UPI0027E01DC8|nr:ketopantoate reductase family protein [Neobacillus sp. PS3-40]WML42904.1 ketopantoate reductase family protein [Neobacillus sp. PS3-40]